MMFSVLELSANFESHYLFLHIFTCHITAERVQSAIQNLREEFGEQRVWGTTCDVKEGKDVKALVAFAHDKLKHIDIWVYQMHTTIEAIGVNFDEDLMFAAYGATKRSVVHLTKSLQAELKMQDVKKVVVHNLS
ncbi:hypothetical protein IFM89_014972, partial [Coptis chinensis]